MKIKKAFDICKKNKSIYISMTSEGEQWLSGLEKVFIFRLAIKYGLIKKTDNPVVFYFEKKNKAGKESEKNDD